MSPRAWIFVALALLASSCHSERGAEVVDLEPYRGNSDRLEGTQTCAIHDHSVLVDDAPDTHAAHAGGEPDVSPLDFLPFGKAFAFL